MLLDICTGFGFIPVFSAPKARGLRPTAAKTTGERPDGWISSNTVEGSEIPKKNTWDVKKNLNRNNGDIHYQTSTGEFSGFLVAINSSDH